jgi:ATP-dependent exoDNAse (exonuclease V) beta subunit
MQARLLILANAGSGKTHELVTRCIKLLSLGQKPAEILALTFTRKAAAEFLQKLFERLGEAAANDGKLAALAGDLGTSVSRAQCIRWMRELVEVMPRLSMGTMDQFFGRIVRSFPFELGVARDFELLDDAARQENLRRTLDRLFRESAGHGSGLRELVELLRRNSRDRSDASALRALQEDISRLHEQISGPSKDVAWGDENEIWKAPHPCAFLAAPPLPAAADAFWREVGETQGDELPANFHAYLAQVVALARHRAPGAGLGSKLGKLAGYLGKEWKFVKKDNATFLRFGNHGRLRQAGNLVALCADFRSSLIQTELRSRLDSSAALYQLLRRYDRIYTETVRGTGALTFADVTEILAGRSGDLKDDIAYRLDSRHKHWLLDEFQDTSRAQWEVLEPLVSEVLMDSGDDRTFFYVGDTKQSIYGWRGGDDRLFREIYRHYTKNKKDHIEEARLDSSWRSDKAILDVVNQVFNDRAMEAHAGEFGFPGGVVGRWREGWVEHTKRQGGAGPGYVRLHDLAVDTDEDDDEAIERELVRLIAGEIKPLERGLTCAVLTRTGRAAEHYANVLGQAGIKAVTEGRFEACKSSPENLALLAAVRCVASPSERIAAAHFLASPFGRNLCPDGSERLSRFRAAAFASAADHGFAATIRGWIKGTGPAVDPAAVAAFVDAAAEFDAVRKPSDDWHTFINHLEHYTLQENESPGVVRVMTVHQAKGLGMDVVVLPELGGNQSLAQLKLSGISLVRDDEGKVIWGLDLPSSEICDADPELRRARDAMKANQTFGELCVFYVAMTRAKHAIYCLAAERQNRKNAARWLMRTFPAGAEGDSIREVGDRTWFRQVTKPAPEKPVTIEGARLRGAGEKPAVVPSAREDEDIPAAIILGGGAARHLGTEVHELLARVEWLGDEPAFPDATAEAAKLVRGFLASERASVLKKPAGRHLLWRERAFDVEIGGRPVSGVFDRVHVQLDEHDRPVGARIFDFKTDKDTAGLRAKYADQLASYAAAAAALLGIPADTVEADTVAVRE